MRANQHQQLPNDDKALLVEHCFRLRGTKLNTLSDSERAELTEDIEHLEQRIAEVV